MPRYVCDFDQVISAGEELIDSAIEMNTITKNYSSNIDNDLEETDHCPGFGSAAKFVATTFLELERDISIYSIPAVTLVEIMGSKPSSNSTVGIPLEYLS